MLSRVTISRDQASTLKKALVSLVVFIGISHLAFQITRSLIDLSDFWIDLSNRFNVDEEASFPTWFSSSLLLMLALGAYTLSAKKKQAKKTVWKAISIAFLLMSVDEGSSLHETIIWPLRRALDIEAGSILTNAWVIIGVFIVAGLGIGLLKSQQYLHPVTRKYFVLGFMLYVAGILGAETIGGLFVENETLYRTWVVLIEELLELSGLTLFAFGILAEFTDS